jgi:hypothetical protein
VPYPVHTRACAWVNSVSNLLASIQLTTAKWNDQIGKASPNKGRLCSSTVVICPNDCANDILRPCSEHSPSIKPFISPCKPFLCLRHRLALDHKRKAPKGAYMRVRWLLATLKPITVFLIPIPGGFFGLLVGIVSLIGNH